MADLKVRVEGFGNVYLEDMGGYYNASDENGNPLGEIDPCDIEDWDDSDSKILGEVIGDLIDEGYLAKTTIGYDEMDDY